MLPNFEVVNQFMMMDLCASWGKGGGRDFIVKVSAHVTPGLKIWNGRLMKMVNTRASIFKNGLNKLVICLIA